MHDVNLRTVGACNRRGIVERFLGGIRKVSCQEDVLERNGRLRLWDLSLLDFS